MLTNDTLGARENRILVAAHMVGEYFYPNHGPHAPTWILVPAIKEIAESRVDASPEELFERFVAYSGGKYLKYLSQYLAALSTGELTSSVPDIADSYTISVFTGGRRLSVLRLATMVSFFAVGENPICKHKLNDLLFYSDFTNYYLWGHSISGAKYVRERNSPTMHRYASMLKLLLYTGVVRFENGSSDSKIIATGRPRLDDLSLSESISLHRVNADFGPMTSAEIRDRAQKESVYRFTCQDEYISYEYARLLTGLPGPTRC